MSNTEQSISINQFYKSFAIAKHPRNERLQGQADSVAMSKRQKTQTSPLPPDLDGEIRVSRTGEARRRQREQGRTRLKEMLELPEKPAKGEADWQKTNGAGHQRRVIRRQVREIPVESNVWFAIGLAAVGIAAGAALTAATVVDNPVVIAILWTVATCVALAGASYFIVHHDVNRGRRIKRSEVVEEYAEEV